MKSLHIFLVVCLIAAVILDSVPYVVIGAIVGYFLGAPKKE